MGMYLNMWEHTKTQRISLRQRFRKIQRKIKSQMLTFLSFRNLQYIAQLMKGQSQNKKIFWQSKRIHTDLCRGKKNSKNKWIQVFISVQTAVDTKFRLPGSKMYTIWKPVCINCDGGNRSFAKLHMRRARWILLTVLNWTPHFFKTCDIQRSCYIKSANVLTIPNKLTQVQAALRRPNRSVCAVCQGYQKTVFVWNWQELLSYLDIDISWEGESFRGQKEKKSEEMKGQNKKTIKPLFILNHKM